MRKLLNTLYVTSENSYLALDGENLVVYDEKKELGRLPLHNLDGIVSFGYRGTSPRSLLSHINIFFHCFFWISGNQSGVNGSMC